MDYRLLSVEDAARFIGWKTSRLRKAIQRGTGPRALHVSGRRIEIEMAELKKWIDGMKPTKEREMSLLPKRKKKEKRTIRDFVEEVSARPEPRAPEDDAVTRAREELAPALVKIDAALKSIFAFREEIRSELDAIRATNSPRMMAFAGIPRTYELVEAACSLSDSFDSIISSLEDAARNIRNLEAHSISGHGLENLRIFASRIHGEKDLRGSWGRIQNLVRTIEEAGDQKFEVIGSNPTPSYHAGPGPNWDRQQKADSTFDPMSDD